MLIGEVASRVGVSVQTVRYYERRGLVSSRRRPSGYREYDEAAVRRIRIVRAAQTFGFSLREIEILMRENPRDVRVAAIRKVDSINGKIGDLHDLRSRLLELLASCRCEDPRDCLALK